MNIVYHTLGKSPALLRLPVFLSGSLTIAAVWLLCRLFYKNNALIALTAAGLTAFAPYLIAYSVNARGYEIQAFLSVLTVGLAVYGKRRQNIFAWFLLIIFSALNFFTLPIALYPFGGICLWLLLNVVFFNAENTAFSSRWQLLKYLIFTGICVAILSLLLYVPLFRYSGLDSFFGNIYIGGTEASTYGETMMSRLKDSVEAFSGTLPHTLVWCIAAGILASPFLFLKNSDERVSFGAALLLWMAFLIPFQRPNLWPRTVLFLHPFLLMFAASGWSGLRLLSGFRRLSVYLIGMMVLAAGLSQFLEAVKVCGVIGPDEKAVRLIIDREGANAGSIHFVTAAQDNAPLWIYADAYGLPRKIFDKREAFNTVYAFVNMGDIRDDIPLLDVQVVGRLAIYSGGRIVVAIDDLTTGRDLRRHLCDKLLLAKDALIVGHLQRLHARWILADSTTHVSTWTDGQQIGAHGGELGTYALLRTLTDGHHDDHGSNANDDAQHREERAHLVVGHGLQAYFE